MQLTKFFAVFVILIGRICLSKIIIDTNNRVEFAELETAAIEVLKNCYADRDKTIILAGDFPGDFITKLSVLKKMSVVLLDDRRRAEENIHFWRGKKSKRGHKVHILVMVAPYFRRFTRTFQTYMFSRYYTTITSALILGWSPKIKNAGCDGSHGTLDLLNNANANNILYTNLLCRHHTKGIVMFGFNAFTNYAPKPWQFVGSWRRVKTDHVFFYFGREYRHDDDGMCENLFFDKTQDLNGWPIKLLILCERPPCAGKMEKFLIKNRQMYLHHEKIFSYIRHFITYVNGTQAIVWRNKIVGKYSEPEHDSFHVLPSHLREISWALSFTYPYGTNCKHLITQFRGNKSQLRKIYDIIDSGSWVGMSIVYLITLIFFKCFLHQTLIEGLLNICRLTCNLGLTTSPRNMASRIYLGCLFFFSVTMLGIFTGNLASLLTHDIPDRQVHSIRDLIDLNYMVHAGKHDLKQIRDAGFKGRLIERIANENCLPYVKRYPLRACLSWSVGEQIEARESKLYVSNYCIRSEYIINVIPWKWHLETKINTFLLIKMAGGIMTDLDVIVGIERVLEAELEEPLPNPVIITLADLGFAFSIFGIGFGCAFISFIAEITIYRFQRRVTTTRVIVLN